MKIETYKETSARTQAAWLAGAVVGGFAVPAVFAGLLHLSRNVFLLPFGAAAVAFLYAYFRSSGVDLMAYFRRRPGPGVVGAAIAGALVVSNVLSQPPSSALAGWDLIAAVLWPGLFYGALDALLLSVMPVMAVSLALERPGIASAAAALAASMAVTAAYHFGYPEFRGPQVMGPVIGNAILTTSYLATRSPLSPALAHIAMHVAAVLHGMETTIQLPPHY